MLKLHASRRKFKVYLILIVNAVSIAGIHTFFIENPSNSALIRPHLSTPTLTSSSLLSTSSAPPLHNSAQRTDQHERDRRTIINHLLGCFTSASALITYENYDCAVRRPTTRKGSVKGMGWRDSESDDQEDHFPSYNDVLLRHRKETVPRWRRIQAEAEVKVDSVEIDEAVSRAADQILEALFAVDTMKKWATEYEWDLIESKLSSPLFGDDLDTSCAILRSRRVYTTRDDDVIGFNWGSCAWRHCGALADAQEAVAELRSSLGLLEPFECLFVLDVMERSLRDVLALVPSRQWKGDIPLYVPYVKEEDGINDQDSTSNLTLDENFIKTLNALKNKF